MTITKLATISSHLVTHVTDGSIARVSNLQLTYGGSLDDYKWISLVSDTIGGGTPCLNPADAAFPAGVANSGSLRAGDHSMQPNEMLINTETLSSSNTYAVCYTELKGDTTATWTDSGIRLQLSKVTTIQYGTDSQSFPVRNMLSTNLAAAINRLPQVPDTPITYTGDLAVNKWLSIVAASHNNYNPCVEGSVAAAAADETYSGPSLQAGGSDKIVTIPQAPFLAVDTEFAICYAEGAASLTAEAFYALNFKTLGSFDDGTTSDVTWRDSYVRIRISKLLSVASHLVTHVTDGSLARVSDLQVTHYSNPYVERWLSLVDDTLGANFPCDYGLIAAQSAGSQYSGSLLTNRMQSNTQLIMSEDGGNFGPGDTITGQSKFSVATISGTFAAGDVITGSSIFNVTNSSGNFTAGDIIVGQSNFTVNTTSGTFSEGEAITGTWVTFTCAETSGVFAAEDVLTGQSNFTIATTSGTIAADDVLTSSRANTCRTSRLPKGCIY
jgi:hypothetical protein